MIDFTPDHRCTVLRPTWYTAQPVTASDWVLISVAPGYFELDSIVQISKTVQEVREYFNSQIALAGFLYTMSDPTITAKTSLRMLLQTYTDAVGIQTTCPGVLLAGLTASDEARLRLALIPLLLARPDYAGALPAALNDLPAAAQVVLRCYATAAVLLQAQYTAQLNAIFGQQPCLPDWFSADLGVPRTGPVVERLAAPAECQRRLSGQTINWGGTDAHGAKSLLRFAEQQQRWAATSIKA